MDNHEIFAVINKEIIFHSNLSTDFELTVDDDEDGLEFTLRTMNNDEITFMPDQFDDLVTFLGAVRVELKQRFPSAFKPTYRGK